MFMYESIKEALPERLHEYFHKLTIGVNIPPRIKREIREIATEDINHAEDFS